MTLMLQSWALAIQLEQMEREERDFLVAYVEAEGPTCVLLWEDVPDPRQPQRVCGFKMVPGWFGDVGEA